MHRVALEIFIDKISKTNPLIEPFNKKSSDFLEDILAKEKNLFEELREELILQIDESDNDIIHLIIGNLTPAGFLSHPISYLCQGLDIDITRAEEVRLLLMQSSHLGLASYNSGEYILFMTDHYYGNSSVEYQVADILAQHPNSLSIKTLQKKLSYDQDTLSQALDNIKKISPSPLSGNDTHIIYPDFVVSVQDGELVINASPYSTPNIRIKDYQESNYTPQELKTFLKQTKALQKALTLREDSLHKHAKALILARSDFFVDGLPTQLTSLQDIANITNRHISTVSRALKDRYFMFDNQIYSFSILWNKKIGNSDTYTIKNIIKQLIYNENQPLSDSNITDILHKKGIKIARRTVNKYRKELQLHSSYQRNS